MHFKQLIITGLLLLAAFTIRAQVKPVIPAARLKAAEELLVASNLESQMGAMYANMTTAAGAQLPADKKDKFKQVMLSFLSKYMSYESLKKDLAQIYAEEFTEDELKEITRFYLTPAGKKMNSKLSTLQQKGIMLAQEKLKAHSAELQQDMQKELGN